MNAHSGVTVGMTVSVVFFLLGYWQRRQVTKHRILMIAAVATNLATAALLLVAVYSWHAGDFRAAGFQPTVPAWAILAHRIAAMVATALMLGMVYTGMRRLRAIHTRLHIFFLPLYLIVYTTGLLFFSGRN